MKLDIGSPGEYQSTYSQGYPILVILMSATRVQQLGVIAIYLFVNSTPFYILYLYTHIGSSVQSHLVQNSPLELPFLSFFLSYSQNIHIK